jgi:hemolysin activation/secretion protein
VLKIWTQYSVLLLIPILLTSVPTIAYSAEANDACFNITKVELLGVASISERKLQNLFFNNDRSCVGLDEINEYLTLISSHYFEKGYITTRAYLPQQNLTSGTLIIEVIEGSVTKVVATQNSKIQKFNAFPFMKNKVLNLRDIEQGIDQLNRLARNQTYMELAPGEAIGSSEIQIYNQPQRFWQASARIDNSGSPSTGELQVRLNTSFDHLLRLNDYLSISYQSDIENKESGRKSETVTFHGDVPFGYWLVAIDANDYNYKNPIKGDNQSFESKGTSNSQTLTVSKVLYRGQTGKTESINSLTRKSNANYIEDVKLDTSSRTLAVAKVQIRHRELLPKNQVVQASIGIKHGLNLFGSPDKSSVEGAPEPLYLALNGDISYQKTAQIFNKNLSLSSGLTWQYSDDVLFGSEQIGVGGLYSVRGFKGESVSGRSGAYLHNDLSWSHRLPKNWFQLHSISPSLGWDIGGIFNEDSHPHNEELLQGVSLGIRLGGKHIAGDITLARALSRPETFENSLNQIHFAITFKR